ncbi:MAG: hypothetical protein II694_11165 [Lachnospiraceae bacterium]|nr:hypothetical protein [Lachnospiraceae bacterium]
MSSKNYLEKDVPECYYLISMVMGAIDYYMFYESWAGKPGVDDARHHSFDELPHGKEVVGELSDIVKTVYLDGLENADIAEASRRIFEFRERVKELAIDLISYSDRFKLHEYVINRIKPVDKSTLKVFNNDAAARDVLSAVFSSGENAEINENIKLAVSQLPLRMSKTKFFDIMENSLKKYIGTDSLALDRELYMLRTSSGLKSVSSDVYPGLEAKLNELAGADYDNVDEISYPVLEARLIEAVQVITDMSELLQSAETIVNRMAVMVMCFANVETVFAKETANVKVLVSEAAEGLADPADKEMSDDVLKSLQMLEGIFEPVMERLQKYQTRAAKQNLDGSDTDVRPLLETFDSCEKLMSPSVFADLKDEASHELAEVEVQGRFEEIKSELSEAFGSDMKLMQRARMAAILSQLPVFFNSRTDVMNYVRDSLDGCRDTYEKMVAVKLILDTAKTNR